MKTIEENAQQIRDVIRYLKKFKSATIVIYLDDGILESSLLASHIHDISLLHEAGLKVLIVPGANNNIDSAFDVSNTIMTSLAGEHLSAMIGNWVHARGKGIVDGVDYGSSGEIDKLDIDSIRKVLDDGFIPIFPCVGWSVNGKPYSISPIQLATQIAVALKAEKLFFLAPNALISENNFTIPAMNLEEVEEYLKSQKSIGENVEPSDSSASITEMLSLSKLACSSGVSRCHIVDSNINGTLPCEIFSNLGCGTMIYSENYGKIREMQREDISPVLTLISPFVKKSILLPRSKEQLEMEFSDYIVYEIDGSIRACAALHIYGEKGEIACVAVDETCANIGIGPKIIKHLIKKAKSLKLKSVFVLTTQTADWFENQGFAPAEISSLPEKRKAIWNPARGSKMFELKL